MSASVAELAESGHLSRLESPRKVMAKADLKKVEDWRGSIGKAVARAFSLANVSQKEAAALLGRDQGQVARWISGAERAQLDTLFACEALRQSLVIALAELAEGVTIETTVTIRRIA